MQRFLGIAAAVVLILLGLLWTAQGLGYAGGDASSSRSLAALGPVVAGLGVALAIVVVQSIRRGR